MSLFVTLGFKGVLFNPRECRFEAYHEGKMIMWVSWVVLYAAMWHPIGRQAFRDRFGSLPGQWLHEAVFP